MTTNSYWNEGETKRPDQAGWAMEFVRAAENAFDGDVTIAPREEPTVAENIALAQVHATLALVEQQRIANRIALASAVAQASRSAGMHGSVLGLIAGGIGLFDNPSTEHGAPPLHEDIREGLGL